MRYVKKWELNAEYNMTHAEKDLLLKDLCARLPYGVVVGTTDNDGTIPNFWNLVSYNNLTEDVRLVNCEVNAERLTYFGDAKPYLFPLSHMTEEQKEEWKSLLIREAFGTSDNVFTPQDFYNKHHLDYRGLIPMGLANDATWKNVY